MSLLLRERFGVPEAADAIERALDAVLAEGIRTVDIAEPGCTTVSGSKFTSHVRARVQKTLAQAKSQGA